MGRNAQEKPALGFIGTGLMGAPMARRLLDAGYRVTIWNRSAEKMRPLAEAGAIAADSPAAVGEAAEIVMMCVTDALAVEAVVFGEDGLCAADGTSKLLIDFSSIRPEAAREHAMRLRAQGGWGWIDAPVSGGVPGAEQGSLAIMAGGDAGDIERARPVVEHLASRFTHMGPQGAGQTTKLVNQMIVGCNMVVVAEAIACAQRAGVDAARIPEALKGGFADSIPFQLLAPRYAARTYEPKLGELALMVKDLDTAFDTAREVGARTPMTGLALELLGTLMGRGHAGDDITVIERLYREEEL